MEPVMARQADYALWDGTGCRPAWLVIAVVPRLGRGTSRHHRDIPMNANEAVSNENERSW